MENKDLPNSIEDVTNRVPENKEKIIYVEENGGIYTIKINTDEIYIESFRRTQNKNLNGNDEQSSLK